MSNLENTQWYRNCCNCWTVISLTVTILSFSLGMAQYYITFTYVPTYCLVKSSFLEKCHKPYTGDKLTPQQCFLPIWLVEYKESGKSEQTTIAGSAFWVDRDDSNQLGSFKKYEIGGIYRCYHSNHFSRVRWNKPSFSTFTVLMICGILSTLLCIWLLVLRCCDKRRFSHVYHNSNLQNTPSGTAVPVARGMGIENVPLTPPPPYTPSTIHEEEEDNPITPPPPYTPSIINQEREVENIPLTPPPAYVPSSI